MRLQVSIERLSFSFFSRFLFYAKNGVGFFSSFFFSFFFFLFCFVLFCFVFTFLFSRGFLYGASSPILFPFYAFRRLTGSVDMGASILIWFRLQMSFMSTSSDSPWKKSYLSTLCTIDAKYKLVKRDRCLYSNVSKNQHDKQTNERNETKQTKMLLVNTTRRVVLSVASRTPTQAALVGMGRVPDSSCLSTFAVTVVRNNSRRFLSTTPQQQQQQEQEQVTDGNTTTTAAAPEAATTESTPASPPPPVEEQRQQEEQKQEEEHSRPFFSSGLAFVFGIALGYPIWTNVLSSQDLLQDENDELVRNLRSATEKTRQMRSELGSFFHLFS